MAKMSWMRTAILMVGAAGLAVASWSCKNDGAACTGSGGSGGAALAPVPPQRACSGDGDITTECPLPPSVEGDVDNGDGEVSLYYYSDPSCVNGFCHYCVTWTVTEDPSDTDAQ